MDLQAVMNASGPGDDASDEYEEQIVAEMAQQQQQDEETAEALRAFRQSVLHSDVNSIETESDDERRHRGLTSAVASAGGSRKLSATLSMDSKKTSSSPSAASESASGGRKKKTTPRLTSVTALINHDLTSGDTKAPHKKRKRSDSPPERSSTNAPQVKAKVKVESRRSPAVAVAVQSEREGSSRTLRKFSGASDNGRDVDAHKVKHEAPPSSSVAANTTGTPGVSSANIPTTQAFASPRDFFVAPADDSADASHVVCTLCEVLIGSRVFTLKRHLYRHHPQVFRLQTENGGDHDDTAGPAAATTSRSSLTVVGSTSEPVVKLKLESSVALTPTSSSKRPAKRKSSSANEYDAQGAFEKMNEAFVAWLQSDMIPMKALESALFHQFLSEINPHFKIPEVVIQPRKPLKTTGDAVVENEARVMKGLCLQGNGEPPVLRTDLAIPVPKLGEALIKIVRAGICGTDLMMIDNYKPGFKGVIGHEFVGIVQQVGFVDTATADDAAIVEREWLGKRVVGEINIPCDTDECATCSRGLTSDAQRRQQVKRRNHCPHRAALGIVNKDGVFAEFITLSLANLHVVPEGVVDAHAVFAEPLAAACRILEQQTIPPQARVAILGDGKLGLLVAEVLHAQQQAEGGGANEITLIGKHREKLALMKHIVARTLTLDDVMSERMNYDVCVECTGTPTGMSLALQLLKRGGKLVMKSTCSIKKSPVDLPLVHAKQVEVIGSRCGPFDMAMALLRDKKVDVQKFIHGVYPLERAEAALVHAAQRGALKIQLVIA